MKNNIQFLNSCSSGVWEGVLSLPEQLRAYAMMVENFGSFINKSIKEHSKWVQRCSADVSCKRELARMMPDYRTRKPGAQHCVVQIENDPECASPYLVPDDKVDEGIQKLDLIGLANIVEQNRATLGSSCETQMRTINRQVLDELKGEDWGYAQDLKRYTAIATFDPDCPLAMKLQKPNPQARQNITKPTWLESLGVKWDCYSPEKVDELICLEIAKQVIDPLMVLGGGALALKAMKTAGLRGLANLPVRKAAKSAVDDSAMIAEKAS